MFDISFESFEDFEMILLSQRYIYTHNSLNRENCLLISIKWKTKWNYIKIV